LTARPAGSTLLAAVLRGTSALPVLAAALAVCVAVGMGNTVAFGARAQDLEARWTTLEQAGVPASDLAPLRERLDRLQADRVGPLPYSAVSGGLFGDPLGGVEQQTELIWEDQLAAARADAYAAFGRLRLSTAASDSAYLLAGQAALDRARTPADYRRLAITFDDLAGRAQASAGDELATAAGGMDDGRPADVVDAIDALAGQVDLATSQGLPADPGPAALAEAARYLLLPTPQQLAAHDDVISDLQAASARLQGLLGARDRAGALLAQAQDLLRQFEDLSGGDGGYTDRLAQAQAALASAHDAAALDSALTAATALVSDLQAVIARFNLPSALTAGATCIQGAPAKLIVVHLATESMFVYQDGCPILQTLVTSGRPGLRTDRGDFHIFKKSSPYKFVSPWPPGSPFWYHSAWVNWAMEIVGDGTFLHDAPWQPAGTFGPGSENGPYASHGCIHVPTPVMSWLFGWAPIGTEVIVGS
jgi:lipoprotein-anchoring transpeptidase ErfK/SrfK